MRWASERSRHDGRPTDMVTPKPTRKAEALDRNCCLFVVVQYYVVVYYESIKREPKIRCIYECRCDERLQTKNSNLHSHGFAG
jgi:hypothetical protein